MGTSLFKSTHPPGQSQGSNPASQLLVQSCSPLGRGGASSPWDFVEECLGAKGKSRQTLPQGSSHRALCGSPPPPPWVLLPGIAVPRPSVVGTSNCWPNKTKQEELTVHKTQLVVDKTQHYVHDGAELYWERKREVLAPAQRVAEGTHG